MLDDSFVLVLGKLKTLDLFITNVLEFYRRPPQILQEKRERCAESFLADIKHAKGNTVSPSPESSVISTEPSASFPTWRSLTSYHTEDIRGFLSTALPARSV